MLLVYVNHQGIRIYLPETEEVANLLLGGLAGDAFDVNCCRHDDSVMFGECENGSEYRFYQSEEDIFVVGTTDA
jgi:hypothetical protein